MKPKLPYEIEENPVKGNKFRQAGVRELQIGDEVQVRWFVGKTKWIIGRNTRKIGRKIYELEVRGKKLIRHINHLIRIESNVMPKTPDDNDCWHDSVKID